MSEIIIKKDKNKTPIFSLHTSHCRFNYNEEDKIYLSFHTTKSVSVLLSEKELDILIDRLVLVKEFLKEKNSKKNIK